MNIKEHNALECEMLKTIPPEKRIEFIEQNGANMREILGHKDPLEEFIERTRELFRSIPLDYDERNKREIIENLREGYKGL